MLRWIKYQYYKEVYAAKFFREHTRRMEKVCAEAKKRIDWESNLSLRGQVGMLEVSIARGKRYGLIMEPEDWQAIKVKAAVKAKYKKHLDGESNNANN
jgi:hypothetical protein